MLLRSTTGSSLVILFALADGSLHAQGTTIRISVAADGTQADGPSYDSVMSADQRFIAFDSHASNLVPGDANGFADVFVLDRTLATIERVSVGSSGGDPIDGSSDTPSISADGRLVAFASYASNLVGDDTNGTTDVFVRDRATGVTERVSVDSSGQETAGGSYAPALSADGRLVAFASWAGNLDAGDANDRIDVFVHDRESGSTECVSITASGAHGNDVSEHPAISADGRFVAFQSLASDLVAGDANDAPDVFVRDRSNGTTIRASVGPGDAEADDASFVVASHLSADGRFVAFSSTATNLVAGDANGAGDAFVRDLQAGTTELVSVDSAGIQGDDWTFQPALSADGRFVAFASFADNLVAADTNAVMDVFVRDRVLGTTERANVDSRGSEDNGGNSDLGRLSGDGRFVAFSSPAWNLVYGDTNGTYDLFLRDRAPTGDTTRVSVDSGGAEADGASSFPALISSGQIVAFESDASNLVPNDANGVGDVFVRDRVTGATARVSVDSAGDEGDGRSRGVALDSDGDVVAFESLADDLVAGDGNGASDVFVRDRSNGTTERVSVDSGGAEADGPSRAPALSSDGRVVAFSSAATNLVPIDSNGVEDVFVHDRETGATELVSVTTSGEPGDGASDQPALATDGRVVAFSSVATNLPGGAPAGTKEVYVRDRSAGTTELVSSDSSGAPANGDSSAAAISADGRFVAFESVASNLVAGDANGVADVFVHDRTTGVTELASLDSVGTQADGRSRGPSISADGRFVTFASLATNLVAGDTNGVEDVFTRDRTIALTRRESIDTSGAEGNGASGAGRVAISANAAFVAFDSSASNLVSGDANGADDVFVRDRRSIFATWWNYGAGVPGTFGVPAFTPQHDPVLGAPFTLDLANSRGSSTMAVVFVGFEQASIPSIWGGTLLVSPSLTVLFDLPAAGTSIDGEIPDDPDLRGFVVDLQAIESDPGAPRGVSFSQGLELVLGHY